jgi:hypothetical protein
MGEVGPGDDHSRLVFREDIPEGGNEIPYLFGFHRGFPGFDQGLKGAAQDGDDGREAVLK